VSERRDSDLLTLDQAAAEVGFIGRYRWERMLRRIETKEKDLGRAIMSRVQGPKQARRKISRGALRKHFPELFDESLDQMAKGFQKILGSIDAKLDLRIANHPSIQRLEENARVVRRDVKALAEAVNRLV
jgi:hypothetical protein